MKYIIAALLLAFSFTAAAGSSVNTTGLTDQQHAEMVLQVVKMKGTAANVSTADEVSKWVDIGKNLGQGLAATAKELGITANELADTPVGMVAITVIIWNYMGESIIGILFGIVWFTTMIPTWIWLYRAKFVVRKIEIFEKGKGPDGLIKVKTHHGSTDEGTQFFYLAVLIAIVAVGLLVMF